MQNSKIIGLLKSLNAKEFRLLYKYLRSPFFNYSSAVIGLYEYIRAYYPDFDHRDLDRRLVFEKLFSDSPYNDKKMRNLLHEFHNHVEHFLVQLHIREETFTHKKLLTASLAKRGEYDVFLKKNQLLIQEVKTRPQADIRTFQDLLELEEQFYFHPVTNKIKDGGESLEMMLDQLDAYFITKKLRLASELVARNSIKKQQTTLRLMDGVLAELKEKTKPSNVLFLAYSLLYQLINQGGKPEYFALKEMLFEKFAQLNFNDQQSMLIQLLNFAIRTGNQGDHAFLTESFDLYWFGLEHKLLLENGKVTDSTFTNIVFVGCKVGALDKVETFIQGYVDYLEDSVREDAEKLALAYLYYHRQEYERVDELIGQVPFRQVFYQIRSRGILLLALFELFQQDDSFVEPLLYRIEAFDKYLRRNQAINNTQKGYYVNFLKYLRKITQIGAGPGITPTEKGKLRKEIAGHQDLINKSWLLKQVDQRL